QDAVSRQSVSSCEPCEPLVLFSNQSLGSKDPQIALTVLVKIPDLVGPEGRRVLFIEQREFDSVEPNEAAVSGEPNVAVSSLNNAMDRVLRQPAIRLPDRVSVLACWSARFEGTRARASET